MSKLFSIRLIICTLTILLTISLFNRIIDPFYYYRDIEINGINKFKPKAGRYERYTKPALLIQHQPNALIFGNSISEIAFNPENQYFNNSGELKGYNFSFAESPWEKVFCHFKFATEHTTVKRALIGVSLNDMPIVDCPSNDFYKNMGKISHKDLLLTGSALNASLQTIVEQKNKMNSHTSNGMYFYARGKSGIDERFKISYEKYIETNLSCKKNTTDIQSFDKKLNLSGLRSLIELASAANIDLTIYVYPEHAYTLELEKECRTLNHRWEKLEQLANVLDKPTQKANLHAWHFYGYNSTTAEPISDMTINWQDSFHVNYEMGDLMLLDMFSNKPKKIARPIKNSIITDGMKAMLKEREMYLDKNPKFTKNFRSLLPKQFINNLPENLDKREPIPLAKALQPANP